MFEQFEVQIWSNVNYDKLIAEIYFDNKIVALINQDNGLENLIIEFPGPGHIEEKVMRRVKLSDFLSAIEFAKKELFEKGLESKEEAKGTSSAPG